VKIELEEPDPTVMCAKRGIDTGFAATANETVPLEIPLALDVMLSQEESLVADHWHLLPVETLKLPVLAYGEAEKLEGEAEKVQLA
jgi:hypothetical protein